MSEAPASRKAKNNNAKRWDTIARSYIEEGAEDLHHAAEDVNGFLRRELGDWILEQGLRKAKDAVRKIEWGMNQLQQTRIPSFVEEVLAEGASE